MKNKSLYDKINMKETIMEVTDKKISTKNIVILIVLFVIGVALTLYFCRWYQVIDQNKKSVPIIRGTLSEITKQELDDYLLENPTNVIYLCTSDSQQCRNYEKDVRSYFTKNGLSESIIYVNLTNINQTKFVKNFNQKHQYKVKLTTNYPAIIYFSDGEIKDMIQGKKGNTLTLKRTKEFFKDNEIGE